MVIDAVVGVNGEGCHSTFWTAGLGPEKRPCVGLPWEQPPRAGCLERIDVARIRTIKPEFPHSESMGRISRDARLTFILLWTIADDSGRLRGNSRMLASLLFPYDDDAIHLMSTWLDELHREQCIIQYIRDDNHYIQICNWLNHQRIDKPSKSKIPEFYEPSANPRESSRALNEPSQILQVGSKDQGRDRETASLDRVVPLNQLQGNEGKS